MQSSLLQTTRNTTPLAPTPLVSFIITRHNSQDVFANCLDHVRRCGIRSSEAEIIILDQTADDSAEKRLARNFELIDLMIQAENPRVRTLREAAQRARGRYLLLLTDDCAPQPGSITRMIQHFDADPNLAAAVFTVTQSDGGGFDPAFPNVIQRSGTGVRRRFLDHVNICDDASELISDFHLSLQLLGAGYDIKLFDDLHVLRQISDAADVHDDFSDYVRNTLLLLTRLCPYRLLMPYAIDWISRLRYLAMQHGLQWGFLKGIAGSLKGTMNRLPVDEYAFDALLQTPQIEQRMAEMQRLYGLKKIILLNYSPNIRAFDQAARKCGVRVMGLADPDFAGPDRAYRGLPILPDHAAVEMDFDASLISTLVPAHAARRSRHWSALDKRPVIDLFAPNEALIFAAAAAPESESLRIAARSA